MASSSRRAGRPTAPLRHGPVIKGSILADPTWSEIVPLELGQYEEIRADSRHILNTSGHHAAAQGAAVVVAERDDYVIFEKIGFGLTHLSFRP
jgi:hypothetical protein